MIIFLICPPSSMYEAKRTLLLFKSDTTGEKGFEEFYTENETLDMDKFKALGVIKNEAVYDEQKLKALLY